MKHSIDEIKKKKTTLEGKNSRKEDAEEWTMTWKLQ